MTEPVGFIGLGVMGRPMAAHLAKAGRNPRIWNRTPGKAEGIEGAVKCDSIGDVVATGGVEFVCVSRSEDVEEVLSQSISAAPSGTLFVDHSTIAPENARRLGTLLRGQGFRFMDAPVTGGSVGAENGSLTAFCGGENADFDRALPYMSAYCKTAELVGGVGAGQTMKMANQIAVCLTVLSMAECVTFARKSGLDVDQTLRLVGSGAGGSWSLSNYGPKVVAEDWAPGFTVDLQQKDLVYALEAAREAGVSLPGTALAHQLFAALQNEGRGGDSTAALADVLSSLAGGSR